MTTKAQFISQARKANPKPQYRTENGVQIELTDEEYEHSLEMWAEMKVQQAEVEAAKQAEADAKASAIAKLAALGLTEEEAKAIVGGI